MNHKSINMANEIPSVKKSDIRITVSLNEEKHPVDINWKADDSGIQEMQNAKAFMIALWESEEKGALRIDLWTNKMSVEEMQTFFYQTFASMADTYERATSDKENAKEMRDFARSYGKKVKVIG